MSELAPQSGSREQSPASRSASREAEVQKVNEKIDNLVRERNKLLREEKETNPFVDRLVTDRFMFSFRYSANDPDPKIAEESNPGLLQRFTEALTGEFNQYLKDTSLGLLIHNMQKLEYDPKAVAAKQVCKSTLVIVEVRGRPSEVLKVKIAVQERIDKKGLIILNAVALMVEETKFQPLQDAARNMSRMSGVAKGRNDIDIVTGKVNQIEKEVKEYKKTLEEKKLEAIRKVEQKFLDSFDKSKEGENDNFGWKKVEEQQNLSDATIKMLVEDMKEFKKNEEKRKGTIDQCLQDREEWGRKIEDLERELKKYEKYGSKPLPGKDKWNPGVRVVASEQVTQKFKPRQFGIAYDINGVVIASKTHFITKGNRIVKVGDVPFSRVALNCADEGKIEYEVTFEIRQHMGTLVKEEGEYVEVFLDSDGEYMDFTRKIPKHQVQLMTDFLEMKATQVENKLLKELFVAQQDVLEPYRFPELVPLQSCFLRMCCFPLPHMEILSHQEPLREIGCLADSALLACCCCFGDNHVNNHAKCLDEYKESRFVRTVRPPGPPKKAEHTCTFTASQDIGVVAKWSTGVVTSVIKDGQADKEGVKIGMRFSKVGLQDYSEENLDTAIKEAKEKQMPYKVTFAIEAYFWPEWDSMQGKKEGTSLQKYIETQQRQLSLPYASVIDELNTMVQAEFTVTFKPGPLGIRYDLDNGTVLSVDEAGQNYSYLTAGMRLAKINDVEYSANVLQKHIDGKVDYMVTVVVEEVAAGDYVELRAPKDVTESLKIALSQKKDVAPGLKIQGMATKLFADGTVEIIEEKSGEKMRVNKHHLRKTLLKATMQESMKQAKQKEQQAQAEIKLSFQPDKELGIRTNADGLVMFVHPNTQAAEKGVEAGMHITKVGPDKYSYDDIVAKRKEKDDYDVTFVPRKEPTMPVSRQLEMLREKPLQEAGVAAILSQYDASDYPKDGSQDLLAAQPKTRWLTPEERPAGDAKTEELVV